MKRNSLLIFGVAMLAMTFAACSEELNNESEPALVKDGGKAVTVVVSDHGFDNATPATRATDSNEETIEDNKTVMTTTFEEGDSIGVFAISSQGSIPLNNSYVNKALYYKNGEWIAKDGEEFLYYNGVDYFAYYPYKEGLTIEDVDPTNHTAEGFFHDYIVAFEPYKDQYTKWRYTRSDLMVGQGALVGTECQFQMKHVMGLMVIQTPILHHTYVNVNDENNRYEVDEYYSIDRTEKAVRLVDGSQPIYRYIVKPNQEADIQGRTFVDEDGNYNIFNIHHAGVDGGYYKKYVVDGGTRSETIGSFDNWYIFNNDGTITEDKVSYKTPLGIIVYCGTGGASEYRHGLVMNPFISTYTKWCSGSTADEEFGIDYVSTADDIFTAFDGYANTQKLVAHTATAGHSHQAADIYNFNFKEAYYCPYTTTGWFMPSIGQVLAVYGTDGIGNTDLYSHRNEWFSTATSQSNGGKYQDPDAIRTLYTNMNNAMKKIDSSKFYSYSGSSSMVEAGKIFRIACIYNETGMKYFQVWVNASNAFSNTNLGVLAF